MASNTSPSEILLDALSTIIQQGLQLHKDSQVDLLAEHRASIVDFLEKRPVSSSLLLYTTAEEGDARPKVSVADVALPQQSGEVRSMYLLKLRADLPQPTDEVSALSAIAEFLDWGVLPGHSLVMLERLLKDVIIPLVGTESES